MALAEEPDDQDKVVEIPLLGLDVLLGDAASIHPDVLAQADLASPRVDGLVQDLSAAHHELERASHVRVLARAEQARLAALIGQNRGRITTWRLVEDERESEVAEADRILIGFSVESYTQDDPQTRLEEGLGESLSPAPHLLGAAQLELEADLVAAKDRLNEARLALADLLEERGELVGAINAAVCEETRSTEIRTVSESTIGELTPLLAEAVLLAPLAGC